jgi:hypothetical protein
LTTTAGRTREQAMYLATVIFVAGALLALRGIISQHRS